ncbi:MAG: hypothetical protein J6Z43_04845, partial [Clostridiales bacterium]|nr:hypothetical protein [Clostridiales bacterium]
TILIGAGVFYRNDDYIDFGAEGVYTRLDDVDSISDAHIKGVFKLIYVDYTDAYGEQMFILEGANEDSLIKGEDYSSTLEWVFINTDYSTTPWGVMISGGDGTEASPFTFANVVDLNLPGYGQEYTEGEGETWKSDDNDGLTFRVADPTAQDDEYLYDLHESVLVDGIVVNPSNYSRDKGSLIIKINSDFLKTLDEGKHSVTIVFKDGDDRGAIDSTFNVVKVPQKAADKSSAQTGEYAGTIVLIASAIFVAAGAAFVVKAKKA